MSDPDQFPPDAEQVQGLEQTPLEVLANDGGLEQPTQDPTVAIVSDEGAEG